MIKIQILTQKDNHKKRRNVATDKGAFLEKLECSFQTFYTKYHYLKLDRNIFRN